MMIPGTEYILETGLKKERKQYCLRSQTVKNLKSNSQDAMKGGKPFILIPQDRLCRFEERLVSRFLYHFLAVRQSRTRK